MHVGSFSSSIRPSEQLRVESACLLPSSALETAFLLGLQQQLDNEGAPVFLAPIKRRKTSTFSGCSWAGSLSNSPGSYVWHLIFWYLWPILGRAIEWTKCEHFHQLISQLLGVSCSCQHPHLFIHALGSARMLSHTSNKLVRTHPPLTQTMWLFSMAL